jgi:hypothetical protein
MANATLLLALGIVQSVHSDIVMLSYRVATV